MLFRSERIRTTEGISQQIYSLPRLTTSVPPPQAKAGAGDGNRTHVASLEGWSSTIELHPRLPYSSGPGARAAGRPSSPPPILVRMEERLVRFRPRAILTVIGVVVLILVLRRLHPLRSPVNAGGPTR